MSDFEHLDYYELLGVARSASVDEIKRAYRREISKFHPDRFVNGTPQEQEYASLRSQHLTEAYSVLSDFSARSSYNRGQTPSAGRSRPLQPTAVPVQPRDHQAELYEQAQTHLTAGRLLQAIGALRQLQQINPFYRDSAELLAATETRLSSSTNQSAHSAQSGRRSPRLLMIVGGVAGGVVVVALAVWALGLRGATASRNPGAATAPAALVATDVPTQSPAPTLAPALPTAAPAVAIVPSAVPSTELPSSAPTDAPIDFPTVTPTTAAPTAPLGEQGALLFSDKFANAGWATMRSTGWQVGYQGGRYRVSADQGLGTIWSFRTAPAKDASIGVDVQVTSGEGGLLLRYLDASNYLSVSLNPSQTSFRIEQHSRGAISVLGGGQSEAIQPGPQATNRLVTRLNGDHIDVLCNGQLIAAVDATGAPDSDRYGLLVIPNDSAAEAFFDNLEIRSLDS